MMGAAWMYYLFLLRNRRKDHLNETAFAKVLAIMYMMVGALLSIIVINNYGFPTIPTMFGWMLTSAIVWDWAFKQDDKWNRSSSPTVGGNGMNKYEEAFQRWKQYNFNPADLPDDADEYGRIIDGMEQDFDLVQEGLKKAEVFDLVFSGYVEERGCPGECKDCDTDDYCPFTIVRGVEK